MYRLLDCGLGPGETRELPRYLLKEDSLRVMKRHPISLALQIAQSRSYLHTLEPKVGIIHILGALGCGSTVPSNVMFS